MRATLADIAKATGVSTSSVADVLRGRKGYSQKTRQRIMAAAQRLNFVPNHLARSLLTQQSHTIGVAARLDNAIVTGPLLHGIVTKLATSNHMPLFADISAPEDGVALALRELRARCVDGLIINAPISAQELGQLLPGATPCVMVRHDFEDECPAVVIDVVAALERGVQWLVERGHRRIAFMGVGNAKAVRKQNSHRLKIVGYESAMKRLGLYDPSLLLDASWRPGQTRQFVHEHADLFRSITAVLACNDCVAVEVMTALGELGVNVPRDCSVIGYDDTDFAVAVTPRLTTFHRRYGEVGELAAELMQQVLAGQRPPTVRVAPELVERESAMAVRPSR